MDDDLKRAMKIDPELNSYRAFFDHEWSRTILNRTAGTLLAGAAFDLTLNWKGASNLHTVRHLIINSLGTLWNAVKRTRGAQTITASLIQFMADHLANELSKGRNDLTRDQKKAVRKALDKLAKKAHHADERAADNTNLPTAQVWSDYTTPGNPGAPEFHLIIVESQRACYGSQVHAYENYIRHVICANNGHDGTWEPHLDALKKEAERLLGPAIVAECIDDPQVKAAREVRNALAHRGGLENARTRNTPHGLQVVDGHLQIMANDNRRLFGLLKDRAYKLADAAA